jgi:hypothetical protein
MTTHRRALLPGVSPAAVPPPVVVDARSAIARARRRAIFRDVLDLLLLGSVDGLFFRYPHTHIPMLSRGETLALLLVVHALFVTHAWAARALPRWRARRVAATWCVAERAKFLAQPSARG